MENANVNLSQKYSTILISRRILWIWWECWSVQRNGQDEWKFFYQTRDHYQNKFGSGNVRLRLYYPSEIFKF